MQVINEIMKDPKILVERTMDMPFQIQRWWIAAYEEHPYHILIETFLILLCLYIILFKRSYNPKKKGFGARPPEKLTEEEIDDLIQEWTPEPLLAALPSTNALTTRKDVVIENVLSASRVQVRGVSKPVVNFASYDFLDLATNQKIKDMAVKTLGEYGCGSCGPRGFYGTFDAHLNLEKALAKFYGTDGAIIYSDTVSTSSSVVPAFAKRGDLIVCDDGVSSPILVGLRLSRAKILYFKHNDMKDLERVLQKVAKGYAKSGRKLDSQRRFIVVEGLYRDYGDFCPLKTILKFKETYKYRVVVDDSYGCFACGKNGAGVLDVEEVQSKQVDIFVGSMATTLGSVGGFCAGSTEVIAHQRLSGAGYVFSASQPPFTCTSAQSALKLVSSKESEDARAQLKANANDLRADLIDLGKFEISKDYMYHCSPIVYVRLKNAKGDEAAQERELQRIAENVFRQGILIRRAIFRPMWKLPKKSKSPSAPRPALRVLVNAAHTREDISKLVAALNKAC